MNLLHKNKLGLLVVAFGMFPSNAAEGRGASRLPLERSHARTNVQVSPAASAAAPAPSDANPSSAASSAPSSASAATTSSQTQSTPAEKPIDCSVVAGIPKKVSGMCQKLCSYYDHIILHLPVLEDKYKNMETVQALTSSFKKTMITAEVIREGRDKGSLQLLVNPNLEKMTPVQLLNVLASAPYNATEDPNYLFTVSGENISLPRFLQYAIQNGCRNYSNAPAIAGSANQKTQKKISKSLENLVELFEKSIKLLSPIYQKPTLHKNLAHIEKADHLENTFEILYSSVSDVPIEIAHGDPKINDDPAHAVDIRHINDMNSWLKILVANKNNFTSEEYISFINSTAINNLVPNQIQHFTDSFHIIVLAKMKTLIIKDPTYLIDLKEWKDKDEKIAYITVADKSGPIQKTIVDVILDAMKQVDLRKKKPELDTIATQVFNNLSTAITKYDRKKNLNKG